MRYAILSDIHANCTALKRVLKDVRAQGADKIVCLGDVVGYGPDAEDTVALVRKTVDVCLMGNHDAAVAGVISGAGFSMTALRGVKRHREETSDQSKAWLKGLPYLFQEDDMACAHGEFSAPEKFNYIMTPLDALASWATRRERVLFVGHTHAAAVFALNEQGSPILIPVSDSVELRRDRRYLVNVGSVGYPRHEPTVSYCIYDSEKSTLALRRLPFDFKDFEKRMAKRDIELPAWYERLKDGGQR